MTCLIPFLLASTILSALVNASPMVESAPVTPIPPSKDSFYTAPKHYQHASPGTPLRIRIAPGNATQVFNCSTAYNILYRTIDSHERPSWAVTTLYVPMNMSISTSHAAYNRFNSTPLLSYQYPYDSADIDASPSYDTFSGPGVFEVPAALAHGWWVNVPDYEGPLASFQLGIQAGYATLDSIRAVLSSELGLLPHTTSVALRGYSGGTMASEKATELQPHYAPELKLIGAALGGLIANVSASAEAINKGPFAGLLPAGILGMMTQYPTLDTYIHSQLRSEGLFNKTTFFSFKHFSLIEAFAAFPFQDIANYFVDGEAVFQSPLVQRIFVKEGLMGLHGTPKLPMFIYMAVADEMSPIANTDRLVGKFCKRGSNILFQRNTIGGHITEAANGSPRALEWLSSLFDGTYNLKYSSRGCAVQNVTISIDIRLS